MAATCEPPTSRDGLRSSVVSVVAFRRKEEGEVPSAKCFGFVPTYDEKPRRRLRELLKRQGMQENQQVVFMPDGGENVRRIQASATTQRTLNRLVSHHHAGDGDA